MVGAQAAIDLDQLLLAEELLTRLAPFDDRCQEAERLAILGIVYYHRGDLTAFRQLCRQGMELARTWLTLLFMGRSSLPQEGLGYLQDALGLAHTPWQISRVCVGLARNLGRLGRYREALHHASRVRQLVGDTDPLFLLEWAECALYGDDQTPLEELATLAQQGAQHPSPAVRAEGLRLLSEVYLIQQRLPEALQVFEASLEVLRPNQLPFRALVGIHIYQALGLAQKAQVMVQACQLAASLSPLHQGLAELAQGTMLSPRPQAAKHLRQAIELLREVSPLEAVRAATQLAQLQKTDLAPPFRAVLEGWSLRARQHLLLVQPPTPLPVFHFQALGQIALQGPSGEIHLRYRSAELLVLLLSRPGGWESKELAMALYQQPRIDTLKKELQRLRSSLNGHLEARPWRLVCPIAADFQQVEQWVNQGDLAAALQAFQGGLLPRSLSPGIEELRLQLENKLRTAVLSTKNVVPLLELCRRFPDDLELWEAALQLLRPADPRRPPVLARLQRLQREYTSEHP